MLQFGDPGEAGVWKGLDVVEPVGDTGRDWATPPKYPDCIARMPNKSPSSICLTFNSCVS